MAAFDGDALGTAINNAIAGLTVENKSNTEEVWKVISTAIVDHIKSSMNTVFTAGVPVGGDGGATLQTTWKTQTS